MASWSEILTEVEQSKTALDVLQCKMDDLLKSIANKTGRNIITYYSSWLTKPQAENVDINDSDMNAFMQAVYRLDKSKGVDLILHTPGGNVTAAENIVSYLHSIFGNDVRAIIPQMAMSAGTMIALSCDVIMMGKQSCLGPVDPQMGGISCQEALDEFEKAVNDTKTEPTSLPLWQTRIAKYPPTFLVSCKNAIDLSKSYTENWLSKIYNVTGDELKRMSDVFTEHKESKTHSRHITPLQCKEIGLNILDMESDNELQDLLLSLHHCHMIFFDKTQVVKAVSNNIGARYYRVSNAK